MEHREEGSCQCCRQRLTPRDKERTRALQNRLKRMQGQLGGISRMLEEDRYCADVLMQVAAVEKALKSFGYEVLEDHLHACVARRVQAGEVEVLDETMELVRRLS